MRRGGRVGPCIGDKRHFVGTGEHRIWSKVHAGGKVVFRFLSWTSGKRVGRARDWVDFTCFKFNVFCFTHTFQWVTTKCIYVHHHLPSNLCFLGCSFGVEVCTPERPFTQVYFRISRKLLVRNEDPPNEWKLCSTPVWEISLILEPLMAGVGMGCENTDRKQEDRGTKHRCSFKNGHKN